MPTWKGNWSEEQLYQGSVAVPTAAALSQPVCSGVHRLSLKIVIPAVAIVAGRMIAIEVCLRHVYGICFSDEPRVVSVRLTMWTYE